MASVSNTSTDASALNLNSLFTEPPPKDSPPNTVSTLVRSTPFLELEVQNIATLLQPINTRWARVPRLYAVLRMIDQLPLLDSVFLPHGLTDFWLPFSLGSLPDSVSLDVRAAFVRVQPVVLTKATDLEKGERGRHHHFGPDEPLPFESKGSLGAGGFGAVDRVVSNISGKEYARKRLPRGIVRKTGAAGPKAREHMKAFLAELDVLKRLRHRHVVEYVGSYTAAQHLGIIMAPVADGNLAWFMDSISGGAAGDDATSTTTTPTEKRALLRTFFGCLASALSYLHASQIRHKDVKPQNILVMTAAGAASVLLTDFGLSLDWADLSRSTTKGAPAALTPRYAAPEVADHEPRGASSDVWSLGCVFLEMVTVLKGETLEAMRAFYERCGTESLIYLANEVANREWVKVLEGKGGTKVDSVPLGWVERMLERERKDRVSAAELVEMIVARDLHTGVASRFCGSCCQPQDDSDDYDYGEDTEEEDEEGEDEYEDHLTGQSAGKAPAVDVALEIRTLQQVADTLASDNIVSLRTWRDAADKALSRLENDTSLPVAEAGKLLHELVVLLRDAAWGMLSGDITGSKTSSGVMAKEMLELLERTAMLSLSGETAVDREELSQCIKYVAALPLNDKASGRLAEAKRRLLGGPVDAEAEEGVGEAPVPGSTPQALDAFPLHGAAERDDLAALTELLAGGADPNLQDAERLTALHHAARAGSAACTSKLLSSGANTNAEDANHRTPLHFAGEQGNRIVVRELTKQRSTRLNGKTSDTGSTPLHLAVQAGHVAAAGLILGAGADVHARDAAERIPLSYAPSPEMIHVLVRHGVNLMATSTGGQTALHLAISERRLGVLSALLDAGLTASTTDAGGRNALHVAVAVQNYEAVKVLLLGDRSIIDLPMSGRGEDTTPIHLATGQGDEQMIRLLLDHGAQARFASSPPLNIAVVGGRLDQVKLFYANGQGLDIQGSGGLPLDIAAKSRNLPMARWLVEHGARYTIETSRGSQNVLHDAIDAGDAELAEVLLDSLGSDALPGSGAKKIRSRSPAFTAEGRFTAIALYSSIFWQHSSITRMLLDRGADPNGPNRVPLLAAVYKDDLESAQLLFDHGVDVHKGDDEGEAAIHWAASKSTVAMAELLVAHGANVNQASNTRDFPKTAVYHALMSQKLDMVTYLVDRAGAQVHIELLELATSNERGPAMAVFLSHPAQIVPSPPSPEQLRRLLTQASKSGSPAVEALVKASAGNTAGPEMQDSLYYAIVRHNADGVASLVDAGADPLAPSESTYGRTLESSALDALGDCLRRHSPTPTQEEETRGSAAVLRVLLDKATARGARSREQVLQEWVQYAGQSVGPQVVKWLFEEGAEGNVQAAYKYVRPGYLQSPLQYAVDNQDMDWARQRLAKGDDVSGVKVCHTPLQFAARDGNAEMIKLLLDHGAATHPRSADDVGIPPGVDMIGNTALLRAVEAQCVDGVRLLLDAGADPNRNRAGNPPPKGTKRSWRDPQTDTSQWLPLAKAVDNAVTEMRRSRSTKVDDCMETVRLLLAAGADPAKPSSYGGDALSVARAGGQVSSELLRMLADHCKDTDEKGELDGLFKVKA